MGTTPHELRAILEKMMEELINPAHHFMICASYFEHITPPYSHLEKHYIAVVYFHQEAAWNIELSESHLEADVLLNPSTPTISQHIRIPLSEIWSVQKSDSKIFTDAGRLFYAEPVFKKMLSTH